MSDAFVNLESDTYVRALWHVLCQDFNIMAWIYRPKGNPWVIGYRFRHYRDERAFNSADEKSGYVIDLRRNSEPSDSELDEIGATFDFMFGEIVAMERSHGRTAEVHRTDCKCMGNEASALLMAQPWMHTVFGGQTSAKPQRGST